MKFTDACAFLLVLFFAPLIPGIINRTKAFFGGRNGQPLCQLYFDLFRLIRKTPVYSKSTSLVFRVAPSVILATSITALMILPGSKESGLISFQGDIFLFFYLLALGRLFIVLGALDTASAFEGMGASRELFFSALAELAVFFSLLFLATASSSTSFAGMLSGTASLISSHPVEVLLAAVSFFFVLLIENARIPVDDPTTHLELTMIHEVMILDHSGPELAYLEYAASLKLWAFSTIILHLLFPFDFGSNAYGFLSLFAGISVIAVMVGIVESCLARFSMPRVPQFIAGAWASAGLSLILFMIRNLHNS